MNSDKSDILLLTLSLISMVSSFKLYLDLLYSILFSNKSKTSQSKKSVKKILSIIGLEFKKLKGEKKKCKNSN